MPVPYLYVPEEPNTTLNCATIHELQRIRHGRNTTLIEYKYEELDPARIMIDFIGGKPRKVGIELKDEIIIPVSIPDLCERNDIRWNQLTPADLFFLLYPVVRDLVIQHCILNDVTTPLD